MMSNLKYYVKCTLLLSVSMLFFCAHANGAATASAPSRIKIVTHTKKDKNTTENISSIISQHLIRLKHQSARYLVGTNAIKAANKKAMRGPNSEDYLNSIMTYDFVPGALYQVYCAPLNVTDLELKTGEQIVSVAAGDTLRWEVSRTYSGIGATRQEHLLLKPVDVDLTNGLVITTNERTYHLELHSTSDTYMADVRWRYPGDGFVQNYSPTQNNSSTPAEIAQDVNLGHLDFNYTADLFGGEKTPSWMPSMVFNDGKKTYIQFPQDMQVTPSLFVNDGVNTGRVVNYRVENNYYVIDGIYNQMQLRVGQNSKIIVLLNHGDDNQ